MANAGTTAGMDASLSSLNSADNDTSVPSSANLDTQPSKWTSASTSLAASPVASRDGSPTRPNKLPGRLSRTSTSPVQSRKNSVQDLSPTRTRSNAPASAIPRQLSATSTPSLPPPSNTDTILRAPVPHKSSSVIHETSRDSPRWPVSPRLKSPPPNFGRPTAASSARRNDQEPPVINVQRATPSPHVEPSLPPAADMEAEEPYLSSGMRTPARGPSNGSSTLETVQEVSQPNTPRPGLDAAIKKLEETATAQNVSQKKSSDSASNSARTTQNTTNSESGSDSGSVKTNTRRSSAAVLPPLLHSRQSSSALKFHASSKADIFEAKVASAVEEANSSDSDETFVYDSNPPDAERPRRYHSRTPSAASMASQVDRNGMRSIHTVLDGGAHNVHAKKSMKFVNTYNGNSNDNIQGDDDGRGTGRSNTGSARGTARHHHHHHGRWARNNSNNHLSLFDNESPFPASPRTKFSSNNSRQPSNPPSPRMNSNRGWLSAGKRQLALSNGYDMDDTTPGADDEQTPLLQPGTPRGARFNRNRRNGPLRNVEAQTYHQNPSFLNRFASCLVLTVMLLLVITGGIGFMFATSQPLTDVELLKIGNVLASEQELMFDLTVQAHNPNVVVVMIDSADIEVFAKSPHAGNDSEWWRHPHRGDFKILDDPQDDQPDLNDPDESTSPNMRLGNVHTFDSPLTYEGSFFQRGSTTSSGELRLTRPGNTTESGTERWERIISDDFTLVIKGVLKYTLPLSRKIRKVSISGKTLVKPNAANDPALQPNEPEISISDQPPQLGQP
ncbi:hypothetical protein F4777DRAFT_81978 [Nemania sp. FL0916]|nr:hypothetical protein F4777DRAFT_81978 [Nemania sp. FL0916]